MEQVYSRRSFLILSIIAFAIGIRIVQMIWKGPSLIEPTNYSYEMGRVTAYSGKFDLSGREIDRKYLDDEKAAASAQAKKADEAKKKAAKKDAKKDTKKKTAVADKQKQKTVDMRLVGSDEKSATSGTDLSGNEPYAYYTQVQNSTPDDKADDPNDETTKKKKSIGEWRTMLTQNPSTQNLDEFLVAYHRGEVSDSDFYALAFELFKDHSQTREQAGYYLLNKNTAVSGFYHLASEYSNVDEIHRGKLWRIMLDSAQVSKLPNLNFALTSSQSSQQAGPVHFGLQVLQIAVANQNQIIASQNNNGAPGNRNVATTPQPRAFNIFLPSLTQISQRPGPDAQLAATLLSQIQILVH